MIKEVFLKSWINLKQNWKLLVPDLIYNTVIVFISFYLAADFATLSNVFSVDVATIDNFSNPAVISALSFVGIFLIFEFLLSIAVDSIRFGLIADVIKKNKCLLSNFKEYTKKYYFNILKMKLWIGLIYALAGLLSFVVAILFNLTVLKDYIIYVFFAVAGLIYLFMSLSLVFRYPILIMENKKAWDSILTSYKFFRNNFNYTLQIGIIMAVFALAVSAVTSYLIPLTGIAALNLVGILINTILVVWLSLFTFNAYHPKKKP